MGGSSEIPWAPDVPLLRHLTWREAHMLELGLWPGIGIALAVAGERWGIGLLLVMIVRRRLQDPDQREDGDDLVAGYVRDAWYMVAGAVGGMAVVALLIGVVLG